MIDISIYKTTIGKFIFKKKSCLVIIFEINKTLKTNFDNIILYFDLIVY